MKKIFLLIIMADLGSQVDAQIVPTAGSYYTNNTMGAFHGTWQWTSGTDTVKLYLTTKKVYFNMNGGFHMDMLTGWHIYKSGNSVIESSYSYINVVAGATISCSNVGEPVGVAGGSLKDITKNKDGELKLTLNAAQSELTWRSTEHQGMRVYSRPQDVPPAGLTLPRNMVLIKQ